MHKITFLVLFSLVAISAIGQKTYDYPVAPKDSVVDTYFDIEVHDPYQWMENPSDPRLAEWLNVQKKINKKQESHQYNKSSLRGQIASLYHDTDEETIDGYVKKEKKNKDKYEFKFDSKNDNRMPDLLYKIKGNGNYRYLVKVKDFRKSKDDNVVITSKIVNPSQDLIAIEMSHNGSDWREVYFFNLKDGTQLPDTLKYLRAGSHILWHKNGVYYDGYSKPEKGRELLDKAKGQALYTHKIGTSQTDDKMLYQNPDTTGTNYFTYSLEDSTKLFFYHFLKSRGTTYKALSYASIKEDESFFLKNFLLYPNSDSIFFRIEELNGDTTILQTNFGAPNGKVMKAEINRLNKLEEFIPEVDAPLRSVNRLGKDKVACIYRNDGQFIALIYSMNGKLLKKIDFPFGKKVRYLYEDDLEAEYTDFCISSFYHPDIWYQLSLTDLTFKPSKTIWIPYNAEDLETKYVKYRSKDGTEIPMYITCLKSTKLNGKNPTLLYGYGGYGTTVEPSFNESRTLWLLHGGILAIPNIRGGGEEGTDWGKAGRRLKKHNTIDDFIAAAEYLINENYTNPQKLAISGASHGGLLVGAAITQRPDLFKAAIAEAGPFDMLRFENYTAGGVNTNILEFGTVSNFDDFENLKSYSPLHNIKKDVTYPNVLLITGDSDDRVPPFHSYKFLAALQEKGSPKSLYQIYIIPGAAHGGALTQTEWEDKLLFEYYFLFDQLDLSF